ncbi:hypothetical protein COLO4_08600 [Corchorus olitorius]|uniref:Uncharacterized protein n=1 Tax=Corchorus olitorius TaxID=93759 RepID=A0A1R3KFC2_9ROSI|nr:hypothetical protein COLO4_16453 [Corchorus olitorius]OMP05728.1 hypothetical protein COLO4_08600 [Corchorus olitorius]
MGCVGVRMGEWIRVWNQRGKMRVRYMERIRMEVSPVELAW